MYNQQFVLAVLKNNSPVREIDGKITLPFGSEYKIRLKNKNNVRAKARVWIDGRQVSGLGDFILHAGETLDLERFLDESMSEGNRFKFVSLSDSRVNDPTDTENGIIKVEFYLEQINPINLNWNIPIYPVYPSKGPTYPTYPIVDNTGAGGGYRATTTTTFTSNSTLSSTESVAQSNYIASPGQAGATVEGSNSNQRFVEGADFETSTFPTTLTLKIQGPRKRRTPDHGLNPRFLPVYCTGCGISRVRRSDKFCGACGTKFPPKRRKR